ncbi:MAG: carbohydrate kinase family protein [Planctomycetes bacterium]|nr:carbohydrate kinase family protein [Planctomycetota bacterium]
MNTHFDQVCIGMAVNDILITGVDGFSVSDVSVFAEDIVSLAGGDAVNQAVNMAAMGFKVGLLALVGDDPQGKSVVNYCAEKGVDTGGVAVSGDYSTSTTIGLIRKSGERTFIVKRPAASNRLSLSDIELDRIRDGVKVVAIGSLFTSEGLDNAALSAIFKQAKSVNAITVADLVMDLDDWTLDDIGGALAHLDYIAPSRSEAEFYTGKISLPEIASVFKRYGVKNVIVKLGADGVYGNIDDREYHVGAMADAVVDTTGAGDSFMAGFMAGLQDNVSPELCLRLGCAASAISIQRVGATGAIHSRQQVYDYARRH